MEPKKSRVVEIPPNEVLDYEVYEEFKRHALNSSMWYLGRFPAHSSKIRQRLFEKGYPDEPTQFREFDGELNSGHIVELVLEDLKNMHMLNDELFIESKLKSAVYRGKGLSLAARELKFKGIPGEQIDEVLESLQGELDSELLDSVNRAAQKAMRSSGFRKATNGWQKNMVISGALRAKGFDRDLIDQWIESNAEIFEE